MEPNSNQAAPRRALHRFAVATALATLGLIAMGGLVTSHGAGMAVPDWPTTYGYNMFLFPISLWKGGIFYEHSHRLYASAVGLLTVILAVWLWFAAPTRGLKWAGIIALWLVGVQGALGGMRVVLFKDQIGIVHATLAQLFLVWMSGIALGTSSWWVNFPRGKTVAAVPTVLPRAFGVVTMLVLVQLILGASMRHQHAGLAVADFPLAYGKLWPATDAESVLRYNQARVETTAYNQITGSQVLLHMSHRVGAVVIYAAVALCAWLATRRLSVRHPVARLALAWFGIVNLQFLLGAATVWSVKAADVATAHVVTGALALLTGAGATAVALRARGDELTLSAANAREEQPAWSPKISAEVAR